MCRFSLQQTPPPDSSSELALDTLLADDDFNWYNAIECLRDDELAEYGKGAHQEAPPARQDGAAPAPSSSYTGVSGSSEAGATTYDLVELFKTQVEQDPATPLSGAQAQQLQAYGVPPFQAQPVPQQQAQATPAVSNLYDYSPSSCPAAPMEAGVASAPMPGCSTAVSHQVPPALLATASYTQMTPSMSLMTPVAPVAPYVVSAVVRKPGSKAQRTQAELDAAVERIKQKRRESAQRSRTRKNDYMRQLEIENQNLQDEVIRLQNMLAAMQRGASTTQQQLLPMMEM